MSQPPCSDTAPPSTSASALCSTSTASGTASSSQLHPPPSPSSSTPSSSSPPPPPPPPPVPSSTAGKRKASSDLLDTSRVKTTSDEAMQRRGGGSGDEEEVRLSLIAPTLQQMATEAGQSWEPGLSTIIASYSAPPSPPYHLLAWHDGGGQVGRCDTCRELVDALREHRGLPPLPRPGDHTVTRRWRRWKSRCGRDTDRRSGVR